MKFVEDVDKNKYESFLRKSPKSHFLQSSAWGDFCIDNKNLLPHYIGIEDDNQNLIATALLLEKKLPLGYTYFYCPRGYILDYSNKELLQFLTNEMRTYVKKRKGIFLKIDPDNIYREEDTLGNVVIEENNDIINTLKSMGYKHLGFTKNFETMQPRYTFRIDMNKSYEEIENAFSKTTKQRIKKAEKLDVEVRKGTIDDINQFYKLMSLTENRKGFITHEEDYYKNLFTIWNKDNTCNIFLGIVDLDKIIKILNEKRLELEKTINEFPENLSNSKKAQKNELTKQLDKIIADIDKYKKCKEEHGSRITLSAHFIIEYENKAWVLYAGNHNILAETYANYKTYESHIKYCYDKGIKMYDQFGTIGDLRKENPLLGLHEFKKKFGGDYVEFCGEFDLITNKIMYFTFTKLVPIYRGIVKKLAKIRKKSKEKN